MIHSLSHVQFLRPVQYLPVKVVRVVRVVGVCMLHA